MICEKFKDNRNYECSGASCWYEYIVKDVVGGSMPDIISRFLGRGNEVNFLVRTVNLTGGRVSYWSHIKNKHMRARTVTHAHFEKRSSMKCPHKAHR